MTPLRGPISLMRKKKLYFTVWVGYNSDYFVENSTEIAVVTKSTFLLTKKIPAVTFTG